jgi:hypothetical protein
MSATVLSIASKGNDAISIQEAEKEARMAEIRRNGDAKVRLPEEFVTAAAEAIACHQMGLKHQTHINGTFEEKVEQEARFNSIVDSVRASFNPAVFTLDDSQDDDLNGGKLLKVGVDLTKTDLSHNLIPVAREAISGKISWMGYQQTNLNDGDGATISMVYPAYRR